MKGRLPMKFCEMGVVMHLTNFALLSSLAVFSIWNDACYFMAAHKNWDI
jgi:hypothetical protein